MESRWSLWNTKCKLALCNEHLEYGLDFRSKRVIGLLLTIRAYLRQTHIRFVADSQGVFGTNA